MSSSMFNKPYFDPLHQNQLTALRFERIQALKELSNNPSDFDANIAYFVKIEKIHNEWMNILKPYVDKENNPKKHHIRVGDLSGEFSFKRKPTAMDNSKKIVFPQDKETKDYIDRLYATDPRITKVDVDEQGPNLEFQINFSDGVELKLNSLTDKTKLDEYKKFFTDKMQELAPKPILSPSPGGTS
jgi:hypothetical protein